MKPSSTTAGRATKRRALIRSSQFGTLERLRNRILGYDVFISYSHLDGLGYAMALENRLKGIDLACFRDAREMPVGSRLDREIDLATTRSRMLVVVGTPAAVTSEWVGREVEMFRRSDRTLFVIDVDGVVDARRPWPGAEGLVYQPEEGESVEHSKPSETVVSAILHAVTFRTRNQIGRWLLSTVGLLIAVLVALFGWQFVQTTRERNEARLQARIAESRRIVTLSESRRQTNPQLSLLLAVEAARIAERAGDPIGAPIEQALRDALAVQGGQALVSPKGKIAKVHLSPDGRWLAAATEGGAALVWELRADRVESVPPSVIEAKTGSVALVGFDAASRRLFLLDADGVRVWDMVERRIASGESVAPGAAQRALISPSRRWMATVNGTEIGVWDLSSPTRISNHARIAAAGAIGGLAFSADERRLAVGFKGEVRILSINREEEPTILRTDGEPPRTVSFSANGEFVIATRSGRMVSRTGDFSSFVDVWRVREPSTPMLRTEAMSFAVSPDSRLLAAGFSDSSARMWNLTLPDPRSAPMELLEGRDRDDDYTHTTMDVEFTPNGEWLVIGGKELRHLYFWRLSAGGIDPECLRLDESTEPISREIGDRSKQVCNELDHSAEKLFVTPDSRWLIAGGLITGAEMWRLTEDYVADQPVRLRSDEQSLATVAIADDSSRFAAVHESTARVWNVGEIERGELTMYPTSTPADATERVSGGDASRVVLSADERWLVSASNGAAFLRDLHRDSRGRLMRLGDFADAVLPVRFSADSRQLLTASGDTVRVWRLDGNLPVQQALVRVPASESFTDAWITGAAFSPDGRWLGAAAGTTAWLWDLQASEPQQTRRSLAGHLDEIGRVEFSGDGSWLMTGSYSANSMLRSNAKPGWTTRLWRIRQDPSTDTVVVADPKNAIPLGSSPNGQWLLTAVDKVGYLWRLADSPPGTAIELQGCPSPLTSARFVADGRLLIATGTVRDAFWILDPKPGKYTCIWDLQAPTAPTVLDGHGSPGLDRRLSPDGRQFATSGVDGAVYLWNLSDLSQPARIFKGLSDFADVIAFSPNGRWLLTASFGLALVWDLQSHSDRPIAELRGHRDIGAATFSTDSTKVATAGVAALFVWDLKHANPSATRVALGGGHSEGPFAFTRDGRWLIASPGQRLALYALHIDDLKALAWHTLGRGFSAEEWNEHFPQEPYRATFAAR